MSSEMTQIGLRVSEEKKSKWEEYVEESEQPSLSQLIRLATEREIARDNPLERPQEGTAENREPAPEVLNRLERISNKLQSMDRRLSAIESDRYGDEDLTKLATEVHRILPTSVSEIQQAIAAKEQEPAIQETDEDIEFMRKGLGETKQESEQMSRSPTQNTSRPSTGSITDLAAILDADEEAVQLAIKRLKSTTHSVHSTESADGTVHYYKED